MASGKKRIGLQALLAASAIFATASISAAEADVGQRSGSTAFCLYELPSDSGAARRRWINLGIVQYVEVGRSEVIVYFGGGNFGSGHEARIPVPGQAEALTLLQKMGERARVCS